MCVSWETLAVAGDGEWRGGGDAVSDHTGRQNPVSNQRVQPSVLR